MPQFPLVLASRRRHSLSRPEPPEAGRQGGQHREGDQEAHQERECDREREVPEQLARDALDVDDRPEDAQRRERRGGDGALYLLGPTGRRHPGRGSQLAVPEDVLEDDDRVVDQHADAQRQAAQAHDVERHARGVHQREGPDHRDGDRQGDRHGIARVPEEEEEHQKGQRPSEHEGRDHVVDRVRDEPGLVGRHVDVDLRILGLELRERPPHQAGDLDRVGSRLLEDQDPDRFAAAVAGQRLALPEAVDDGGHVPEAHEPLGSGLVVPLRPPGHLPGLGRHGHVADLCDGPELAQRAERVAVAALEDRASRSADVGLLERAGHVLQLDAVGLEEGRAHLDLNLAVEASHDLGLRHPVELFEPAAEDRLGQLLRRPEIGAAGHGEHHHGIGLRIHPQDPGAGGRAGQLVAQEVELLPRIEHREVHVRAPREPERDEAHPVARRRGDALHAGHGGHPALDPLGDLPLDLRGRDVGIGREDDEARIADVGEQIDREPDERDAAQQDDGQKEHADRHGPAGRRARQRHAASSLLRPLPRPPALRRRLPA